MSDRYQGSSYRGGGGGGRGPSYRDDRRYAPRHDHGYDNRGAYDARDPYASSYYPDSRGYGERPRRVHKTIPPPRPWDYSRRPPPRTEQERMELERERQAWEEKEEERYQQRMEERERERQREWQSSGGAGYGAADGWRGREHGAEAYERERGARDVGSRRPRSRSPGVDPRYEQRGGWSRASVGSAEGRVREPIGAPEAPAAYPARRSPPPPAGPAAASFEAPEGPSATRREEPPLSPPRGPARDTGFASTPPTGPRASRGAPPAYPSAFRRETPSSTGTYTPGPERDSYMSPSNSRFARNSARDGPQPPTGPYRGGHPFGRARRDTNPYEAPEDDFRGGGGGYPGQSGSSPHETPYSPSTPGGAHTHRLSRTSSSQNPPTPTSLHPPPPPQPSTTTTSNTNHPSSTTTTTTPHFSAATHLTPEFDSELLTLETQRTTFLSNYLFGPKRATLRALLVDLSDAQLELAAASGRKMAADRALEVATETADAYSLEENSKEELLRLMAAQIDVV